jgi:4,5-dihydroxyphthalate decarboxylase
MAVELGLAVCDHDRTRALFDGRAPIEGSDVTAVALEPEESFHRAFKFQEFDVTEISMSSYLLSLARGEAHYVAIPAFVSRLFRHSSIYIRTDRGIKAPADLKGKAHYSFEQGLSVRQVPLEEMFAKSTYELSKI